MSFDGPLVAFRDVLIDDMMDAEAKRTARRQRWNASVEDASVKWNDQFGYKLGPIIDIIDSRLVDREAREMVALVMKARLLMMLAPLFVLAERIDRSVHIISILASPSGAGPQRYAPKPGGPERISVRRLP